MSAAQYEMTEAHGGETALVAQVEALTKDSRLELTKHGKVVGIVCTPEAWMDLIGAYTVQELR